MVRDLSLHLMDIVQNSIVAGATEVGIYYREDTAANLLEIVVEDNGRGMTQEQTESVTNPFYTTRTTRKVGLGIPLLKMTAEATGGSVQVSSVLGEGTRIEGRFYTDQVDMIPQGDTGETVQLLVCGNPRMDFVFSSRRDEREFVLSTIELREILGEVPFTNPEITQWIGRYLEEGLAGILPPKEV